MLIVPFCLWIVTDSILWYFKWAVVSVELANNFVLVLSAYWELYQYTNLELFLQGKIKYWIF